MVRKSTSFLLICFIFGFALSLSAQDEVDSLQSLLRTQAQDSNRVKSNLALYEELKYENPEDAKSYLTDALELSKEIDYQKGILNSLLSKGEFLIDVSLNDSALRTSKHAQLIAEDLGDRKKVMKSIINQGRALINLQRLEEADSLGNICLDMANIAPKDSLIIAYSYSIFASTSYFRNQFDKSIEYDQKSLSYNQKNLLQRARTMHNIASTHTKMRDLDKALAYSTEGLDIARRADDEHQINMFYNQLGRIYTDKKDFDEARRYYSLAVTYFEKIDSKTDLALVFYNLAEIYVELKDFNQGIIAYEKALQINDETNSPLGKAHITYKIGLTYHKMGEFEKAEDYYLKAKPLFKELNIPVMNIYVAKRLSDLYAGIGEYKKGYEYLLEFKLLNDSIFNVNKIRQLAEVEEKYQSEQKQKEIELLSAENQIAALELQKQESQRNYLILAAFLLVVLIGVIYNRYQFKARANAKLKELDTLKTSFFTNISHEFRTPLTLILSPLQGLLKKNKDPETREVLSVIHRNASVLTELTNQLLDLSKLEAGKLNLEVSHGDFGAFIKVLVASFDSLAVAQKVEFSVELGQAPEEAYFDEDKIHKILNNLLSNAFKFTSAEGKVTLNVAQKNGHLSITISDTGKGISASDQELIFKRFHQSNSNDSSTTGTGVGLTLSKELALLHKGDIEVESVKGEGATFILHFPINKSAYDENQINEETTVSGLEISKPYPVAVNGEDKVPEESEKIILIVEDNPDLRSHMSSLLKDDFTVKQSINGKEGIEDALKLVPDVIVTDLMMPEVDGVELCNTLKSNEKTSHIPIIMLTAKADRDTKLDGLKTGADDFLTKPFDNEELLVRIQNLIAQRQKLQSRYAQTLLLEPSKIVVESPDETFIKNALDVVDQHLSNSEFTVDAFQKEMGMSRMQLHRKLKALTNFSASEFIRDIRLQRASDLLSTNGINVSEVAYSCGFNSVSYFTQCFKQKFGVTPAKQNV